MPAPQPRIVAIGGSAGAIEPLLRIVRDLPPSLPAAVLVVVHLPRSGRSALADIIGRASRLPTSWSADGEVLRGGVIRVAPPDHHLTVDDGRLVVRRGPVVNRSRPAIDPLFQSVAVSPGGPHLGVILSGALDDGAIGLRAVLDAGGHGYVQEPATAMFASMPEAALERSPEASVGSPEEIAQRMRGAVDRVARIRPVPVGHAHEVAKEVEMSRGEARPGGLDAIGAVPSVFGCPACGGTLWELEEDGFRFRCRVGHAYAPQSLLDGQGSSVEDSLWVAIRALDEQRVLATRLADRARERGELTAVARFAEQARAAERHAEAIRAILQHEPGASDPLEPPLAGVAAGEGS